MLRRDTTKKYRVYRATQPDMSSVPVNYIQIAEVYIHKDSVPYYIDSSILRFDCALLDQNPPYGTKYPVRYEIKAFDTYGDSSVYSDFASTEGISPDGGIEDGGDNRIANTNTPKEFNLNQNYPNPFNPITNIKYDLPKDVFVKIKIYDILGREIKTIVNEFKKAGSYLVSFNGSELASGIYFYRIEVVDPTGRTGSFLQVKKMLLIK
ncbi:MAG: T9SS type A sorting domain-containing protein [Ignavibacteriae bacterium]|nr:T9SS type A sorting domain-containing protein [Ignavibacteriota bacterium]